MIGKIKNNILFKNTFIYTSLQLINKSIPFFLLPVLTHYLSTDDYGMIATYNTFVSGLAIFVGLSVSGAVSVNFFHMGQEELKRYIGNVFNVLMVSTLAVLIIISLLDMSILQHIKIPIEWIYIAAIVALMQNVTGINLTLWRSQHRAKQFAVYEISETLFNMVVSLLLVIVLSYGWQGRTSGMAMAAIVFGLISFFIVYKRGYSTANFSLHHIKDTLKFGIPLIPHRLALWMRTGVDIFLITSIVGVAQTGLYSVGYQLGAVIGILATAFNNAYSPYLYEKLKDITHEDKRKLVGFTYLYFGGIVLLAVIVSGVFSLILPYIVGPQFQGIDHYIVWIAIAYAFNGMYMMVVNYIFYMKKTHLLSITTISMSILHVVVSYTLIRFFGAIGAAYASVMTFGLTFLWVWYISNKVYPMPWKIFVKEMDK